MPRSGEDNWFGFEKVKVNLFTFSPFYELSQQFYYSVIILLIHETV